MKKVIAAIAILALVAISLTIWKIQPDRGDEIVNNDKIEVSKDIVTNENPQNEEVKIQVQMNGEAYIVTMFDNPTAKELLDQLPLTLEFKDFNNQEKGAQSPKPLTMEGVPEADRGNLNDFVYYEPSNSLVFCYTDIGTWNGIVRLGTFDTSIEEIKELPDGFSAIIEKVN